MTSMNSHQVYALHGFLGAPAEWQDFTFIDHQVVLERPDLGLWQWAELFNAEASKIDGHRILVGYSLGGRLAMHALIAEPKLWSAAILISAHTGLRCQRERDIRLSKDRLWANKFLQLPWNELLQEWNKNPIFGGKPFAHQKQEQHFERHALSQQLQNWSLAKQEYLTPLLKEVKTPILYIAGECDEKFRLIAEDFREFSIAGIAPGAHHRVPWENSEYFINTTETFIKESIRYDS